MSRREHPIVLLCAVLISAGLFCLTGMLGGLGPAELTGALVITVPVALVLRRVAAALAPRRAREPVAAVRARPRPAPLAPPERCS
ncbi:hypothetical protein FSW04_09110 [Baekduia soli]|uniref:Uncharacterized protein n=1 Tax=Baekduia soli TaxID=496014 RepID=A0A5B8U3S7_9ACTN|nr:hypothetical protein [Baekduia soli]QEC47716.1 hypothetical protein FSW04_09110 [Baekduia soli]